MLSLREFESTLRNQTSLNPAFWDGDRLRPEVREKLLAFAGAYARHVKLPPDAVQDVLLVGGNAGYNWTKYSDLDVHLLANRASLGQDRTLVDDLLKAKKKLWSLTHDVTVKGHPLEGYVQDPSEQSPAGQGVYSIQTDEWKKRPERSDHSWTTDKAFTSKVENLQSMIDDLISSSGSITDFNALKHRIADMRRAGLSRGGEYSTENGVFKELRNTGYLKKMTDYVRNATDRGLSL